MLYNKDIAGMDYLHLERLKMQTRLLILAHSFPRPTCEKGRSFLV